MTRILGGMLLVLLLGGLFSSLAAWQQARQNERHLQAELRSAADEIERDLQARLRVYEYRLRGIRGAIHMIGEAQISRQQFERYGQARNLDQEYPGARGFGYIRRVPREQEAAFLASARADGKPDFQIRQINPHEGERFVIQYIEPAARNAPAIGLDIASERNRRRAALSAMRSGQATLTGPISLVQESAATQSGFLFLLPVYRSPLMPQEPAQRQAQTLGWSYAPLSMNEVMAYLDITRKGLHLALLDVTDPGSGQLIFSSHALDSRDLRQTYTVERQLFGRIWRFEVSASNAFAERLDPLQPRLVFLVGCLLSLLLAAIAGSMLQSRARRQESLASRARLATIVENSSDAIIGEALDGRIITWNRAAEQMFGYSATQVLGQPLAPLLVPPERLDEDHRLLQNLARGERGAPLETQRLRQDGSLVDVTITCSLIRERDGRIVGAAKLMHDISDRKRAERYLMEFNARLEQQVSERTAELTQVASLLQSVLDASSRVSIIATDLQGRVLLFNKGAEQLLGYSAEEMVGKAMPERFHLASEIAERSRQLSARYGRPIEGVDVFHYVADQEGAEAREWTYVRKDGSQVPVHMIITAIRTAEGELLGHLGIAQDITERLRVSAELHAAKSAAEAANAAKSLFLANMSHELRTPLNAVIGIAHLLRDTPLDEQQRQLLNKLQIAGRSLLGIINDILDIAKIEAGQMHLENAPFSPQQLFEDLAELFAPQAQDKGLRFSVSGAEQLPAWLQGDALRLNQILMNLIGNALKFTEQGEVDVQVQAETEQDRQWLRVTVRDTGCGIEPAQLQRLFQPFTQADASTTRRFGGTGLGLSVVQGLAQKMGGSVGVDSQPGQGSRFWLRIPLLPVVSDLDRSGEADSLEVLLVEDVAEQRQQLLGLCRALGWRASALSSGEELVELLQARAANGAMLPEVLLVDWQLPGMDGLQALAEARQRLGGQRLPASLIISASEREQIARLDTAHVVDRILSKPVSSSELFNAVNSSVARHFGSTERVCRATRMDAAGTLWLSGLHLLLVDDSEINLEVASLLLSQQGARVHTCRNGREALEALQAAPQAYDAVLMDVQMPEMDGYEATRRLRRELGLLELPVLALTAGALAEERRQAQAAGMNDFLSKPLEPALLIGALRRAVEHARGQPLPVMTQAAPEQIEGWPQIHGIDAASAARRMSHDQRLFRSALQRLLEEFAPFGDVAVLQGMASEQAQELCARLHKLRGSAGLVGAELLRQLAGQAESALRESVDPQRLSNLLASLSQALVSLGHAAAAFLAQQAQPQPVAAAPLAELPAELARLAEQLASNDIAALEQFERLQPNLAALLDATTLEQLSQAVDTLQFRLALDIVQPLLRGSGEPGDA